MRPAWEGEACHLEDLAPLTTDTLQRVQKQAVEDTLALRIIADHWQQHHLPSEDVTAVADVLAALASELPRLISSRQADPTPQETLFT